MQIFGKMAKKLARGAISKFCFSGFLDIVDPYKPAKFGKDRFRNGGATTFFDFAWASMETTSPIRIYNDRPKKSVNGVDMINSSTLINI